MYSYKYVIITFLPGGVPYPTLTNTELYRLLGAGYRMERPDMCSDDVYVTLLRSFYNNYLLTDLIFFRAFVLLQITQNVTPDQRNIKLFAYIFYFHPAEQPRKVIRVSESGKFLLVESEILGFGIQSLVLRIQNPSNDWNPESRVHWQGSRQSGIQNQGCF